MESLIYNYKLLALWGAPSAPMDYYNFSIISQNVVWVVTHDLYQLNVPWVTTHATTARKARALLLREGRAPRRTIKLRQPMTRIFINL